MTSIPEVIARQKCLPTMRDIVADYPAAMTVTSFLLIAAPIECEPNGLEGDGADDVRIAEGNGIDQILRRGVEQGEGSAAEVMERGV